MVTALDFQDKTSEIFLPDFKKDWNGRYRYFCKHCKKSYTTISVLKNHIKFVHGDKSKNSFECNICGKVMAKWSKFHHMEAMHRDKKYECKYCGKNFTRNATKNKHEIMCTLLYN